MLFVVLFFLIISSIAIALLRRNKHTILMLGLCISFVCMFVGIIIYLAKTGGLRTGQKFLLFFDSGIQRKLSYMIFPLQKLGYLIAIGRTLFPGFLLMIAVNYSMHPKFSRLKKYDLLIMLMPILTLILYYPAIFLNLGKRAAYLQIMVINGTLIWIFVYLLLALFLLIQEYRGMTIPYCKKQFRSIMGFLISIGIMYFFYFRQDPIQVYQMYSAEYMRLGGLLYSGTAGGAISRWIFLSVLTTLFGCFGFWSLRTYTLLEQEEVKGDITIQKKFDTASKGISVFVHGMKNQLLSNRILSEKLKAELEKENPDARLLKEYSGMLSDISNNMLVRMEELYKSVQSNYITLTPVDVEEVIDRTVKRFYEKYPDGQIKTSVTAKSQIIADLPYLSEALYNLVINGYEAIIEAERENPELELKAYDERLYVTFQINDNGKGMSKQVQKKVFDPFYTSKNTNYNWGMGLYHVRQIIKSHMGMLKLESTEDKGTKFFVAIPKRELRDRESGENNDKGIDCR